MAQSHEFSKMQLGPVERCRALALAFAALGILGCGTGAGRPDGGAGGGAGSGVQGEPQPGETGGAQGGDASKEAIGTPCVPSEEQVSGFTAYDANEVTLDVDHPACGGGLCVVNHFQGRVSCPYGQTEADLALPADDPRRCRITDADGRPTGEVVESAVPPQLLDRRAEDVVRCSCRCAGPDPNADYCTCPSRMDCVELFEDFGFQNGFEGSYCIALGTTYDEDTAGTATCDKDGTDPGTSCGGSRSNP